VAALTVVAYHYLLAYGPFAWRGFTLGRLTVFGDLPVCVFFVLSGFVLAESGARGQMRWTSTILARYLRLTLPMAVSLVLGWAWLRAFPHSREVIQASGANPWLSTAFISHQPVSVPHALRDAVIGVYLTGSSLYNSVVWTMKIEFFGSVLVYSIYRFLPANARWLGLAGIGAISFRNPFYLGFALGGALREWRVAGLIGGARGGWLMLIGAVALAGCLVGRTLAAFALLTLSAALIVLAILLVGRLQTALESATAQFLGRISFSLYLVHAPLLVTVVAWYQLHIGGESGAKFAGGLAGFTGFSIALAWLLTRLIDEPLLGALQRWKRSRAGDFTHPL
jgi:peptidoglycan/LPS O-acetylase OafA/YrhL